MKAIVLYHNHCLDGVSAALAAYQQYGHEAYYVGVSHRPLLDVDDEDILKIIFDKKRSNHSFNRTIYESFSDLPNNDNLDLFVVDFCLRPNQYLHLSKFFTNIVTLDHHVTAYNDVVDSGLYPKSDKQPAVTTLEVYKRGNIKFFFDQTYSGAVLAHSYFVGSQTPYPFLLVQDRDLWEWGYEDTRNFTTGLHSSGVLSAGAETFPILEEIMLDQDPDNPSWAATAEIGKMFERRKTDEIERTVRQGLAVIKLNHNGDTTEVGFINVSDVGLISDMGNQIVTNDKRDLPIAIMYTVMQDHKIQLSMRSRDGVDCSFIAKRFGGGGHAQACGCSIDLDTFIGILTSGELSI